jgi:hypothetical protein
MSIYQSTLVACGSFLPLFQRNAAHEREIEELDKNRGKMRERERGKSRRIKLK